MQAAARLRSRRPRSNAALFDRMKAELAGDTGLKYLNGDLYGR
ncbi:MAG TPA: hypothetical protein VH302_11195 [Bryobacteraceae bacterium]|nr:hypothetical protein [Bryobacteraceae bacterium]